MMFHSVMDYTDFALQYLLDMLYNSLCQAKSSLGSSQHSPGQMASGRIRGRGERTKGLEPRTAP